MRFEFDYEHWQATRLLDKCWRDRVMADQPPVSAVAFEAFKFMNATKRRTSTCNPITARNSTSTTSPWSASIRSR
jgi:hypothetical protein